MTDRISQGPNHQPNYRLRQGVAAVGLAAVALLGLKTGSDFMNKPTPIENQAKKDEESITKQASSPEGLYIADTSAKDSPLSNVTLRLHKGVTLRQTPARINDDPAAGIDNNIAFSVGEKGSDSIVVFGALQRTDKNGDLWYGFTIGGPVMNPAQPDAGKATVWVDDSEVTRQENATGKRLIDIIAPGSPVENRYLTYSPVAGFNLVEHPNTADQGINVAFANFE